MSRIYRTFAELRVGDVVMTRTGNHRIVRISKQRRTYTSVVFEDGNFARFDGLVPCEKEDSGDNSTRGV